MKTLTTAAISVMIALSANADKVFEWPQLSNGMLPDSEVTTNVALHVDANRLRVFNLRIAAQNITSNEVLVAVGCDADDDGDLSYDETSFVFGYDCGERYFVDYRSGQAVNVTGDTVSIKKKDFDESWNLAKIVKRGEGEVGEAVTETLETVKLEIRLR